MAPRARPAVIRPGAPLAFPDPERADAEGLLAVGGDLSVERLLFAYERGIFPWYSEGLPPLWWSPDPRAVIDDRSLHVSRSLARELRRKKFRVTFDRAFEAVMRECGRDRDDGTWILPEMIEAYVHLHELGHAHSFEAWNGERLVGGLYGVRRGGLFAAESMFHRETSGSKFALVGAVRSLFAAGVVVFDVQFETPHLASMGATTVSRHEYLRRIAAAVNAPVALPRVPEVLATLGEPADG
jgi:leucyl/phenylalanyl-tRNA---protein transferase